MILSDSDIKFRLVDGTLVIDPLSDPDAQIQPASVDLLLGDVRIDPISGCSLSSEGRWILQPRGFTLATTLETVGIPADLVAQVNGKSSLGRKGLFVHITAGFVDPGFRGQITLELFNCSSDTIILTPRQKICQLVVQKLSSVADRPYGHPSRTSKYQNQVGVTESRNPEGK